MSEHFADRLFSRCKQKGAPVCVGIDPVWSRLPRAIRGGDDRVGAKAAVVAISGYVRGVLEAVAPHVPCVKFQSACFERYLWPGVEAYYRLIQNARDLGLIVIADAKRGDIGISAAHYAAGCLADPPFDDIDQTGAADAITVNPYLGADSLEPFIKVAHEQGKGVFALVRTSNPGSDGLQGQVMGDGSTVASVVAKIIAHSGSDSSYLGESGYSLLGAVVGATKSEDVAELRRLMPQQIFLVPGFGAQGGTADDIRGCFRHDGAGALITASRSVIYAYEQDPDRDWQGAIESAAIQLKEQIAGVLEGVG